MSSSCSRCRSQSLSRDDVTGHLACDGCGFVQPFDSFEAQLHTISGPTGTKVRLGTVGSGTVFSYKERKLNEADKLLNDVVFRLGLSASTANAVKSMAGDITAGELGLGRWFSIFVGACVYVVMRSAGKPLPLSDVRSAIDCDCDDFELGRMVSRIVEFLDLRDGNYPGFDVVAAFERALRNSPAFVSAGKESKERMRKQGIFLIQCMVKWSLTTGRKPLPAVAAVLAFVTGARIDEVARQLNAAVHTSKLRYGELSKALVKVAQALPWGKNVTVKNIVMNAPLVIKYMEKKSTMIKSGEKQLARFDLRDAVAECLKKGVDYGNFELKYDSRYFERNGVSLKGKAEKFKLSSESLSMVCAKFSDEIARLKSGKEELHRREERRFELDDCADWWESKSAMHKKLMLKQILEKDVGLESLPPSFVAGCEVYQKRREKISAAKQRIDKIMNPEIAGVDKSDRISVLKDVQTGKKKGTKIGDIDWEDLIIETLILHKVRDEEIETGHYNTLMDLYVFNSGIIPGASS